MGHILAIMSVFFILGCEEARRGIGAYMKFTEKTPNQIYFEYSYSTNLVSKFLTVDYSTRVTSKYVPLETATSI